MFNKYLLFEVFFEWERRYIEYKLSSHFFVDSYNVLVWADIDWFSLTVSTVLNKYFSEYYVIKNKRLILDEKYIFTK